ncbi:MAG: glycoside hydrolase family 92 protein, partial [Chitinophagaceae bacterium]
ILEPTRPAVHLPNSMIRVFPARADQLDDQINYFPLTISSHRQPWLFGILPVSGTVDKLWNQEYTADKEKIRPYQYNVLLEEINTSVSFAPNARTGIFRFEFKNELDNYIRFQILNKGTLTLKDDLTITGTEEFNGMKAYVYAVSDTRILRAVFDDSKKKSLMFVGKGSKTVNIRYGISFISIEQARENLRVESETATLEKLSTHAKKIWNEKLGQIAIKGGTQAQKIVFYTSLYRSYERMIDINEYGKYYSAYDHKVHESDKPFFVDNWLWDTYISLEPLHAILNPVMQGQKIQSYVDMYRHGGWMPSFALLFGDNPCMTGNHAASWIADSYFKGIRNFDVNAAYEGIRKNSLQATLLPWKNGPATILDSFYNAKGYMPALRPGEKEFVKEVHGFEKRQSVSVTLENSYDDWCIALMAKELGKTADATLF